MSDLYSGKYYSESQLSLRYLLTGTEKRDVLAWTEALPQACRACGRMERLEDSLMIQQIQGRSIYKQNRHDIDWLTKYCNIVRPCIAADADYRFSGSLAFP